MIMTFLAIMWQAFRLLLQLGIKPSWFYVTKSTSSDTISSINGDLRGFLLKTSLPVIGETATAEVLLKSLETYRRSGMYILDICY